MLYWELFCFQFKHALILRNIGWNMFGFLKRFFGVDDDKRRKKLYDEQLPPESMRISRAKLIHCVPEIHPQVERISDKRYGCLLEWDLSEQQLTPPKKSFFPKYFFKINRRHRLVLDDFGRRTVELTDGKRTISEIAEILRKNTSYTQEQMEDALLAFYGQLVRRNAASLAGK